MPIKKYYWRRPEYYRAQQRKWLHKRAESAAITRFKRSQKVREFLQHLKETTPCADCGKLYPHYMMEFDHREESGRAENGHRKVSELTTQRWAIVIDEIGRCDVVCANCHSARTWRKQYANHAWGETIIRSRNRKFFVEACSCADASGNGQKGCPVCKGRGAFVKYINPEYCGNEKKVNNDV